MCTYREEAHHVESECGSSWWCWLSITAALAILIARVMLWRSTGGPTGPDMATDPNANEMHQVKTADVAVQTVAAQQKNLYGIIQAELVAEIRARGLVPEKYKAEQIQQLLQSDALRAQSGNTLDGWSFVRPDGSVAAEL